MHTSRLKLRAKTSEQQALVTWGILLPALPWNNFDWPGSILVSPHQDKPLWQHIPVLAQLIGEHMHI